MLRGGILQVERGYTSSREGVYFALGGALCVERGYTLQ